MIVFRPFCGRRAALVLGVATLAAACSALPSSSPEGTITSYVHESGALVFAPRAARAQKVVFDGSSKQLIQEPDTPLRRFFNEHKPDFAPGQLDYAKTTILADIVNRVRGRHELIEATVREVVQRHRERAIVPLRVDRAALDAAQGKLAQALNALGKRFARSDPRENTDDPDTLAKQQSELVEEATEVQRALAVAVDAAEPWVTHPADRDELLAALDEAWRAHVEVKALLLVRIDPAFGLLPGRAEPASADLRLAARRLLVRAREGLSALQRGRQLLPPAEQATALRAANAELLVKALSLVLQQSGFPDGRDRVVDKVIAEVTAGSAPSAGSQRAREVWEAAAAAGYQSALWARRRTWLQERSVELKKRSVERKRGAPTRSREARGSLEDEALRVLARNDLRVADVFHLKPYADSADFPEDVLARDLRQTLLDKAFLERLVSAAVDKRLELFRTGSDPQGPRRKALGRLQRFVRENLGDPLAGELKTDRSLWTAFLTEENQGSERSLRQADDAGAPLEAAELASFGAQLRAALRERLEERPDLERAMRGALALPALARHLVLDHAPGAARTGIQRALAADRSLVSAHEVLARAGSSLAAAGAAARARAVELSESRSALRSAENAAAPVALRAGTALERLRAQLQGLQTVRDATLAPAPGLSAEALLAAPPSPTRGERLLRRAEAAQARAQELLLQKQGRTNASIATLWSGVGGVEPLARALDTALRGLVDAPGRDVERRQRALAAWRASPEAAGEALAAALPPIPIPPELASLDGALRKLAEAVERELEQAELEAQRPARRLAVQVLACSERCLRDQLEPRLVEANRAIATLDAAADRAVWTELGAAARAATDLAVRAQLADEQLARERSRFQETQGQGARPAAGTFLARAAAAVPGANRRLPGAQRVDAAALQAHLLRGVQTQLAAVRAGRAEVPSLEDLLAGALGGFAFPDRSDRARARLQRRFAQVFRGLPGLVTADEAILVAFLRSGEVEFGTPGLVGTAPRLIAAALRAVLGDDAARPGAEAVARAVEQTLERQDVRYLFGFGRVNTDVVRAFKQELVQAFRHRLGAAVAAEREADYDYWWLSFYPKAVPLGNQAFDGESLIQIDFPTSVIPEEQFHRWLQDQADLDGERSEAGCLRSCVPDDLPDLPSWRSRIRHAAGVLGDFMTVLDSSELSDRHPEIRGVILEAMQRLERKPPPCGWSFCGAQLRYLEAIHYLLLRYGEQRLRPLLVELRDGLAACKRNADPGCPADCLLRALEEPLADPAGARCLHALLGTRAADLRDLTCRLKTHSEQQATTAGATRKALAELQRHTDRLLLGRPDWFRLLAAVDGQAAGRERLGELDRLRRQRLVQLGMLLLPGSWDGARGAGLLRKLEAYRKEKTGVERRLARLEPELDTLDVELDAWAVAQEKVAGDLIEALGDSSEPSEDAGTGAEAAGSGLADAKKGLKKACAAFADALTPLRALFPPAAGSAPAHQARSAGELREHVRRARAELWFARERALGGERERLQAEERHARRSEELAWLAERVLLLAQGLPSARYLETLADEVDCFVQRHDPDEVGELLAPDRKPGSGCAGGDSLDGGAAAALHLRALRARAELRAAAQRDLAWRPFGVEHLLFALTAAADLSISLPFKVELYSSAFFDGSRRFAGPRSAGEPGEPLALVPSLRLPETQQTPPARPYVVPFVYAEKRALVRFLGASGAEQPGAFLAGLERVLGDLAAAAGELADEPRDGAVRVYRVQPALEDEEAATGFAGHQLVLPESAIEPREPGELKPTRATAATVSSSRWVTITWEDLRDVERVWRYASSSPARGMLGRARLSYAKLLEGYGALPRRLQRAIDHQAFPRFEYLAQVASRRPLEHPQLWVWEQKLAETREELRFVLVNLFASSYPAVPGRERVRAEFRSRRGHLEALVYQWLRDLWMRCARRGLFEHDEPSGDTWTQSARRIRVLANLLLDRHDYLSEHARAKVLEVIAPEEQSWDFWSDDWTGYAWFPERLPDHPGSIDRWVRELMEEQVVVDELAEHLPDQLYAPLFDAYARLGRTERQVLPLSRVAKPEYQRFLDWGKPKIQEGIQVVDLLPSSRDDLVALSINEGGVIADAAGQLEGAAVFELNRLLLDELRELETGRRGSRERGSEQVGSADAGDPLRQLLGVGSRVSDARQLLQATTSGSGLTAGELSAAARGRGSLFARARAMMTYARRREYLDAAITAAGRGDRFAKWVVRKSDLRSSLAGTADLSAGGDAAQTNVAAAHTGYPNGDQPFHVLLKVPHHAVQTDWRGKRYLLFNSSYSATTRRSWWREYGTLGVLAKLPVVPFNPHAWEYLEQGHVATVYPFKWDVDSKLEQDELVSQTNRLGGRVDLDETDKIPYSDVRALIEAEARFVEETRRAQSSELSASLAGLEEQAQRFQEDLRSHLDRRRSARREQIEAERSARSAELEALEREVESLQQEVERLRGEESSGAETAPTGP